MKKKVLFELFNHLRRSPQWRSKLKMLVGVGMAGLLVVGALGIWASISTVKYVSELAQSAVTQDKISLAQSKISEATNLSIRGCWQGAKDLLSVQAWTEKPIEQNLQHLKLSCVVSPPRCEGEACQKKINPVQEKGGVAT